MTTNTVTSRNIGCVSVRVQHPHRTLYSISCLFPSSWGSTWRFFSARETIKKSIKKLIMVPNFMYLNTRCRNGTYLPFPLYLRSALPYRWWPVWVAANWQIIPTTRLHFQKGLTAASGWSSWSTICERREKMSGSWYWTSILWNVFSKDDFTSFLRAQERTRGSQASCTNVH